MAYSYSGEKKPDLVSTKYCQGGLQALLACQLQKCGLNGYHQFAFCILRVWALVPYEPLGLVQLLSTISPSRVIREEFSWHYQYICKQTGDEKQEEYQLRDTFWFILVIELSGVQFGVQV